MMFRIFKHIIIFLPIFCYSQFSGNFETYIDSVFGINKKVKYKDIVNYEIRQGLKYDSVNKNLNLSYWIQACFKKLGIERYLDEKSRYLAHGSNLNICVVIDCNGSVKKVMSEEKRLDPYLNKKLVGTNFFKDYIRVLKINGLCISSVDEEFYREMLTFSSQFCLVYGDFVNQACSCS